MADIIIKEIYCAGCRLDQEHAMTLDKNKEIQAKCTACGRTLKFPLVDAATLDKLVADHKTASYGQISTEMSDQEQAVRDAEFLKAMRITGI